MQRYIIASIQKENPEQISTQFATVESIDDYIDKAQQLDAKVIKNKQEISKGYYTVLGDPKIPKNTFREWQNKY
jgi:predicted enzyme related to lactoylglutathione lyase